MLKLSVDTITGRVTNHAGSSALLSTTIDGFDEEASMILPTAESTSSAFHYSLVTGDGKKD